MYPSQLPANRVQNDQERQQAQPENNVKVSPPPIPPHHRSASSIHPSNEQVSPINTSDKYKTKDTTANIEAVPDVRATASFTSTETAKLKHQPTDSSTNQLSLRLKQPQAEKIDPSQSMTTNQTATKTVAPASNRPGHYKGLPFKRKT